MISENLSIVWSKHRIIPIDWIYFYREGDKKIYSQFVYNKKPTHAVLETPSDENPYYVFLKSCLGSRQEEIDVQLAARNPFNRTMNKNYSLFELDNLTCFK